MDYKNWNRNRFISASDRIRHKDLNYSASEAFKEVTDLALLIMDLNNSINRYPSKQKDLSLYWAQNKIQELKDELEKIFYRLEKN